MIKRIIFNKTKNYLPRSICFFMPGIGLIFGLIILFTVNQSMKWIISWAVCIFIIFIAVLIGRYKEFFLSLLVLCLPIDADISIYDIKSPVDNLSDPNITLKIIDFPLIVLTIIIIFEIIYRRRRLIFSREIMIPAFFLIALSLFSMLYAPFPSFSILRISELLRAILLFIIIINIISGDKEPKIIVTCLCIGLFLQSVLGISQFYIGNIKGIEFLGQTPEIMEQQLWNRSIVRVGGTLGLPNAFGCYLVMVLPITLVWSAYKKNIFKYFFIIAFTLGTITLFLTASRAGWISYIFAIVIFAVISVKRYRKFKFMLPIFLILLLIPFYFDLIRDRFTESGTDPIESRINLLDTSFNVIKSNPLLGLGLNNFVLAASPYDEKSVLSDVSAPVHNAYLRIACEIGIIGLAIFIWVQAIGMLKLFGARNLSDRYFQLLSFGLLLGLIAFSIDNMFGPEYRHSPITNLFWVYLALADRLSNKAKSVVHISND